MATIIISDDHPFVLMGTKSYVQGLGHHIVDICSNGISAYNSILTHKPDIALLDVTMPGMNGLEVLEKLNGTRLKTKVVLLTMHNEMSIFNRAKSLDVKGYILKDFAVDVLGECIDAVMKGDTWFSKELSENLQIDNVSAQESVLTQLTAAERKIVALIGKQHTSREIAEMLFITEKSVENHRYRIMKKLDLPAEKNALLVWAIKNIPK